MEKIVVKVINKSGFELPQRQTLGAVGLDLCACISESVVLKPLERALIPTGLFCEIPLGYEMQIRPRSGLAAKFGVTVLNTPGTIDPDYRGEIKVILVNLSNEPFEVKPKERIAQAVLAKYENLVWQETMVLDVTERGEGGFGSTGIDNKAGF